MINYKFVEYDCKKLNPGGIVNLLYKVYPSGAKWAVCERYNINDDEFIDIILFKYLSRKVYSIWRRNITPHISYALAGLEHIVAYYNQKYDYMFEHQVQGNDIVNFIKLLE